LYGKNESSICELMTNKGNISLLYCHLGIGLKCQNLLLLYVQEREREGKYTVNVQCSVQYTSFIYCLLVMSYCA